MWHPAGETPPSQQVKLAAHKLVGRVTHVGKCDVFTVEGSNLEEYHIILGEDDEYYCTCPAQRTCKHVLAARECLSAQER